MSVNSKARNSKTMHDIVYELKKENQLLHALLRDRKGFSSSETKPIGTSGGVSGSSGPSGFLRTEGDTMIGPIAFFPDLAIIDAVDDSINISKDAQLAYTSRAIVSAALSTNLETIHGSAFAGQLLMIQGILTETFTIKHGLGNIRTFDGGDIEIVDNQNVWLVFDSIANEWAAVGGSGSGSGTGLHISADLVADQTANVAVGNHVEFDRNAAPTGADGGIVLQTGAGQANGIFELLAGKTYFLSGAVSPIKSASVGVLLAWYDRTNAVELGRRTLYDESNAAFRDNQPKAEIIFTPATDVDVELRIVAFVGTSTNLTGFFAVSTYAHIFEFSGKNGADGAPGVSASITWKNTARAKTLVDVPSLAAFDVITDGVTLVEGDRVLLTEQTAAAENGIYDVGVVAAGLAPLTRSSDFDANDEVVASSILAVEEGTLSKNTIWQLITNNPITVGTTAQVWNEFKPGLDTGIPGVDGNGLDATGSFVLDGRFGVAAAYLKIWEIISITGNVPEDGIAHMIYLPTTVNTKIGRIFLNGQSSSTKGGAYSDNYGTSWTTAASLSSNNGFGNSAYAPNLTTDGTLVTIQTILGATSAVNAMKVSTNRATSFSTITLDFSALGQNFQDVIWSEADGIFLALSNEFPTGQVYTSTDGSSWTRRTTPAPSIGSWTRIVYSPTLGKYFAKNQGTLAGANSEHMESSDGITWSGPTSNDCPIGTPQKQIIWSEGHQKFVGAGTVSGVGTVVVSDDFITWTSVNPPNCSALNDIVLAPDLSLFVVVGSNTASTASPKIFWASNDLINWVNYPVKNFRVNAAAGVSSARTNIVYAEEFGYFFAVNSGFGTGELFFRTAMKIG